MFALSLTSVTAFADFAEDTPVCFVRAYGSDERFFYGETFSMKENETIYLCFNLTAPPEDIEEDLFPYAIFTELKEGDSP